MEFDQNKPIYLQIYDTVCDNILEGALAPDGRVMSVRELGARLGVNPNTVMRTYEKLTSDGMIYNKRGLGYFVSTDARDKVLAVRKQEFLEDVLPRIRHQMELLGIGPEVFTTQAGQA